MIPCEYGTIKALQPLTCTLFAWWDIHVHYISWSGIFQPGFVWHFILLKVKAFHTHYCESVYMYIVNRKVCRYCMHMYNACTSVNDSSAT